MMPLQRVAIIAIVALVALAVGAAVVWVQITAAPDFYRRYEWSDAQRSVLSQQALNSMLLAQKSAQESYFGAVRAMRDRIAGLKAVEPPPRQVTISLTQEQANAFIEHNLQTFTHIQDRYAHLFREPAVFFRDGRIVLAGRTARPECLASLHYRATLDGEGRLCATLERTMAGRVPVPRSVLEGRIERAAESLRPSIAAWKRQANMDDAGGLNAAAVNAGLGLMLLDIAAGRPTDAVMFVPVNDKGTAVPMLITALRVDEEALTVSAKPMSRAQTQALLERIRS